MYPVTVSGQGPFKYLRPTGTPAPQDLDDDGNPKPDPFKEYRCESCDVHWKGTFFCWSCGGDINNEES
jgi:hypothetical protein